MFRLAFYVNILSTCTCTCRFASKPKKGIKFLQEKGLVGKTPEDVAKLFYEDDRLDKVYNIVN